MSLPMLKSCSWVKGSKNFTPAQAAIASAEDMHYSSGTAKSLSTMRLCLCLILDVALFGLRASSDTCNSKTSVSPLARCLIEDTKDMKANPLCDSVTRMFYLNVGS